MKNSLLIVLLIVASHTPPASAYTQKEIECLAENIYYEANSEPFEGKVAVAQVTINRANNENYPRSICSVVHQKTKIGRVYVCQFSWTCNKHLKRADPESLAIARQIAIAVLSDKESIPRLADALYFHSKHVRANWSAVRVATIGNHIFYKDRNEM